jgi:hypothetical protein
MAHRAIRRGTGDRGAAPAKVMTSGVRLLRPLPPDLRSTNVWMAFDSYGLGSNQCTQEVVNALGQSTTLHTGTNYNPAAPIGGNETALSHVCPSAAIGVIF